jgi:hypothetical protein
MILVDARDDEDRIDSILLKNRGMPRTVMVTERSKITSRAARRWQSRTRWK